MAVVIVIWMLRLISGRPAVVSSSPAQVETAGPNLLENPSFARGMHGWTLYHNAQPMQVRIEHSGVAIRPGAAKNSVQEVYQRFEVPPAGTIVASGRVRVSGAPLPADASVIVMVVDSSNKGTTGFYVVPKRGTGAFPFSFVYSPNGTTREFVLGVITGSYSNDRTVVSFDDLKIAKTKD